ncbi:MAG TPA: lysophospholipid acyltransferase family protein [Gammaproteobacteria bacterium]
MKDKFLGPVRLALRGAGLVLAVAWGVLLTSGLLLLRPAGPRLRDRLLQPVARHWFRLVLFTMGVRQRVFGSPAEGPVLVAANHISWLDIVVLGSHIGTCFVSKSEVADWPLVGWLARQGGTLFIHRGHHDSAERIAHDMTARLARKSRVLFFPEGTTSDGTFVKRFKNRLFQPAVQIGASVQPVAIRYARGRETVDPVAYVEGVSMAASLRGVLARQRTDVTVCWCEAFSTVGLERRDVAAEAEARVSAAMAGNGAGSGRPVTVP